MKHLDWISMKQPLTEDDSEEQLEDHPDLVEPDEFILIDWEELKSPSKPANFFRIHDENDCGMPYCPLCDESESWFDDAMAQEEERLFWEGFAEQEYQKDLALGLIELKPKQKEA